MLKNLLPKIQGDRRNRNRKMKIIFIQNKYDRNNNKNEMWYGCVDKEIYGQNKSFFKIQTLTHVLWIS